MGSCCCSASSTASSTAKLADRDEVRRKRAGMIARSQGAEAPPSSGLSDAAASRLDTEKRRQALLGKLEGMYRARGSDPPFGLRSLTLEQLVEHKATLERRGVV